MNIIAILLAVITPIFVNHNDVHGNTQTMTNIQAWAASIGTGGGGLTTNDVNAIIASSNLCSVTAAQAMTNGLFNLAGGAQNMDYSVSLTYGERGAPARENVVSYGRTFGETRFGSIFGTDTSEFNGKAVLAGFSDVAYSMYDESFMHSIVIDNDTGRWKADGNQIAYTSEIPSVSGFVTAVSATNIVTNVVTKAYVESLGISGGVVTTNDVCNIVTNDIVSESWDIPRVWPSYGCVVTNDLLKYENGQWFGHFKGVIFGGIEVDTWIHLCKRFWDGYDWNFGEFETDPNATELWFSGSSSSEIIIDYDAKPNGAQYGQQSQKLISLDTHTRNALGLAYAKDVPSTNGFVTASITNGLESVAHANATFAPKLTGRTYDFHNGSNFVKRVYEALTNVIQTLGGTVANPPTFN